ncbi:YqaA family protein [Larsenimonas suaedae]|uniref:VTT domain-containing protein n=1 Tax=Larsenimonas suaedae TaxID=1851019 RepID=A0ABU1GSP8_9GAMM|nr:VTT domain-containing protein [Larsenimonas suaedae]MCM2972149.1 VTT domain-containing protein [Larsenimonas suaedae]MDR5895055.1 VTT domain-containing protein [Larsenimonas suaedae]
MASSRIYALFQRLQAASQARWANAVLFLAALCEILILPLPIDALLVPWMLANPRRGMWLATIALAGNLLAALIGYGVGALAMESIGHSLLSWTGTLDHFEAFVATMQAHGFWAIVMVAFTPVPFQVALLGAGAAQYPLALFLLACALGRGARFYGLALLVRVGGEPALTAARRHGRAAMGLGALACLVVGGVYLFGRVHS